MRHIHPLEPIAVVVLVVVFFYLRRKQAARAPAKSSGGAAPRTAVEQPVRPAKPPKPEEPPEVVYMNLRRRALETSPQSLGAAGDVAEGEPYGLLMEMAMASSVVTLVCLADGDASLYYQTGGGMVGGIGHESVRRAAKEFIALAGSSLAKMSPTGSTPLPDSGRVRFYVLTPRGTYTAEMDREELGDSGDEFSTLFYSGQEVVARMREVLVQKSA